LDLTLRKSRKPGEDPNSRVVFVKFKDIGNILRISAASIEGRSSRKDGEWIEHSLQKLS
jgi:hypothetical protein